MNKMSAGDSRTYNRIFQHPVAHNLQWKQVYALFRHLGQMEEEANGNFKVTLNGRNLILRPSLSKDVKEIDEVMLIRHFIQLAESAPLPVAKKEQRWVVILDHRKIRLFSSDAPGTEPLVVLPQPPEDFFRQAPHARDFSRGKEKPDPNSFFQPVAEALRPADRILLFGTATGTSSEMEQFVKWIDHRHPDICEKIVGSFPIDERHMSEALILAQAREFYLPLVVADS